MDKFPRLKLAWAAGIIDGEGCILLNLNPKRQTYTLRVSVTNTDPKMLKELKSIFGGSIQAANCRNDKAHWKSKWMWVLTCKQADKALSALLPYLITKKDQAQTALIFKTLHRKRGGVAGVLVPGNNKLFEEQEWLANQLKTMKHESLIESKVL